MIVSGKKVAPQRKMVGGQPTPKPIAQPVPLPAPLRGLVLNENLTNPQPGGALVLDNFIVGESTLIPRKGITKHATIGGAVQSVFGYKSGTDANMFASTATSIYDITAPASPTIAPTADVTGQTSGKYSVEQFTTSGGSFLYAVNGTDSAQLFDGTSWTAITDASTPAITGVTTSALSHVWSFANRLFFVEKDTLDVWYLPVDSIGGAAAQFALGGVFTRGGALLFGATWSLDSGDGPSEQCVFVTTEGEVAVYRGTNPGSAADWAKVGVYEITRPLGPKATMKAGGDLLVATEVGLVPLSEAIRRDIASLSVGASSLQIEPYWQRAAIANTKPWEIAKWPSENIMIVSQPEDDFRDGYVLICNLQTRAWSRFTGMDMQCVEVFDGGAYFGASDGSVYQMQNTGADDGEPYTAVYLGQFEGFGATGVQKTVLQGRPTFTSNTPIAPQITMKVDYDQVLSPAPNAASFTATEGWDVSTWDTSLWDAEGAVAVGANDSRWVGIGATGYAHAMELQITFGSTVAPDVEYVGANVTVNLGALVA